MPKLFFGKHLERNRRKRFEKRCNVGSSKPQGANGEGKKLTAVHTGFCGKQEPVNGGGEERKIASSTGPKRREEVDKQGFSHAKSPVQEKAGEGGGVVIPKGAKPVETLHAESGTYEKKKR